MNNKHNILSIILAVIIFSGVAILAACLNSCSSTIIIDTKKEKECKKDSCCNKTWDSSKFSQALEKSATGSGTKDVMIIKKR